MANVVKKHSISFELAQKMVAEALAKAKEIGVAENVAILDDGGNLKAFGRMDGAPILCIEMAQNKAYTALFGVSTQDFFNFIQGAVGELVGIDGGVVSGVINLESSGVEASDWRPRHDERYHEA
jgi:uncharacterized protein GlcG (DUF336 family)